MDMPLEMLTRIAVLEARFTQIGYERLEGLPIYNNKLHVEAVDFQVCEYGLLGALVTPWFINIMLLPHNVKKYQNTELGRKQTFALASGDYDFVLGDDEAIGRYFFRSVISPPHCYAQQSAARQDAAAALQHLVTSHDEAQPQEEHSQQVAFNPELPEQQGRREFMRNIVSNTVKTTL